MIDLSLHVVTSLVFCWFVGFGLGTTYRAVKVFFEKATGR